VPVFARPRPAAATVGLLLVIGVCLALVLAGAVMVERWGGDPPAARAEARRGSVAVRLLAYTGGCLAAGLLAGVVAAGAGGRLVMRLLAVTSPDAAGSVTEADEIVGESRAGGTLGFLLFVGLPAGELSGLVYAVVRPLLPAGRAGGLALGALLLILAGTTIEPLRAGNPDFTIVGPDWLSVTAFIALALFQGLVVVAAGSRLPRSPIVLGPRAVRAGRIALAVLALVLLPGCVSALVEIMGSAD
jgi:hypothetical protein